MSSLFVSLNASSGNSTGTTTKTLIQYTAPANSGAKVTRFAVNLKGTDPAGAHGVVDIVKGSSSGTGTSLSPVKSHGHTGSVQGTGKENFSGEPSGGTVIFSEAIHPQGGKSIPRDIVLNPGEQLGLRVNIGTSVGFSASFNIEE